MTVRSWAQICFIAVVVFVIVSFIRSCNSDPTEGQLFSALASMRADMDAVIHAGGRVIDYDNNSKTTFARAYLLLSVDAESRSQELLEKYKAVLISREWILVRGDASRVDLCKQGMSTTILVSQDGVRLSVGMVFDATSISSCGLRSLGSNS